MCMCVFHLHVYLLHDLSSLPTKARRHWIPRNWSFRLLLASMWVLGIELGVEFWYS